MSSIAILGCAWGDEAKAKIVDYLNQEENADVVVRFQGGGNAGHTIYVDNKKYVFHMLPCGALNPNSELVIASGCVPNLKSLKEEIESFEKQGFDVLKRLKIYGTATLVVFTDRVDVLRERYYESSGNIGTTKKGIGPTYEKRAARVAIRFVDIFFPEKLKSKLVKLASEVNMLLKAYRAKKEELFSKEDIEQEFENLIQLAEYFKDCIVDDDYIYNCIIFGKNILYEGAQGMLLDPLHGSYPFVTSYSVLAGAILTSCGIGINVAPKRVIGVAKAYFTRVGNGPFPTYIKDKDLQNEIREIGHEFGSTTGRPRNCGWLDIALLKRSIIMNGITEIVLTCIDTLCKIGKVKICVGYKQSEFAPVLIESLDSAIPIYLEYDLSGCSMDGVSKWDEIPFQVQGLIITIENIIGVPVTMLSYGRGRNQIIAKE